MITHTKFYTLLLVIMLVLCDIACVASVDSLKILILKKSNTDKLQLYSIISKEYIGLSPDSVIKYATKGIEFGEKISNNKFLPDFFQMIGYANYYKRNYNLAINYFNKALTIYESRKNKDKIANLNAYLGIIYQDTYNYDKSLQYFYKSIKIYKSLNDSANISGICNNIGLLFFRVNKYEKALYYFNTSLETALKKNLHKSAAFTYNNLSLIYKKMNQFQKALFYLTKSEVILIKLKDISSLITTYENIGETFLKLKRYKDAELYFLKSLKLSIRLNIPISQASIYFNIARINLEKKNYQQAKDFLLLSLNLLNKNKDWGLEKNVCNLFSDYYKKINDYENALIYYKKYKQLNDSIFNKESIENIEKLKIQFETGEIETENELLRQNNIIQDITIKKQNYTRNIYIISILIILVFIFLIIYRFKKKKKATILLQEKNNFIIYQREKLEEVNITKDKFLSIIAHDLKNPFFDFKQYADFLKNTELNDIQSKNEIISDLKTISENTGILLENLLNWAETQRKAIYINKTELNLKDFILESIRPYFISANKKNIKIEIDINQHIRIYADKYTLSTVLGNLFYNAVKFTHKNGAINIYVEISDTKSTIYIKDNGIGISPENLENLFKLNINKSDTGTSNEKGNGLGLIICKEFIEKNGGKIVAESELNKGSIFKIEINNPTN